MKVSENCKCRYKEHANYGVFLGIAVCVGMIALIAIILFVVNRNSPKANSEIIDEVKSIYQGESQHFNTDSDVIDVTIRSRAVNEEKDSETIFVEVVSYSDFVKYSSIYVLYYRSIDGDWVMTDHYMESNQYEILSCPITDADAEAALANFTNDLQGTYSDFSIFDQETDLQAGSCTYVYTAIRHDGYITAVDQFIVSYGFDFTDGWYANPVTVNYGSETWNVEGTWIYSNSNSDISLTIHKISEEEAKIEYDFTYRWPEAGYYGSHMSSYEFKSNRVETRAVYEEDDGIRFLLCDDAEYVYVTKYGGVSYGDVWRGYSNYSMLTSESDQNYAVLETNNVFPNILALSEFCVINRTQKIGLFNGNSSDDSDISGNIFYETYSYMNDDDPSATNAETYDIYGKYNYISGTTFLGRYAQAGSSGTFKIYGDGVLLYEYNASNFTEADCSEDFVVDISDVRELTIEMPGTSCREKISGWVGLYFDHPVMYAANLMLSKDKPYEMYGYYPNDIYDTFDWIKSESTLATGLDYFYQKTGIRTYIAFIAYDEQMYALDSEYNYVLSDYAKKYADELCSNLFGETHYFAVCYFAEEDDDEKNMGGWYRICRSESTNDTLAGMNDVFWDCFLDPEMEYSSYAERFSLGFKQFADAVMTETN